MLQTEKLLVFKTHSVFATYRPFASATIFSTSRAPKRFARTRLSFLLLTGLVVGGKKKVAVTRHNSSNRARHWKCLGHE